MIRAFVSYCHADEQYRAELEKHLSLLRRQGVAPGVRLLVVLSESYRHGPGAVKSG